MRGVPQSVLNYATPKQIKSYLQDPRTQLEGAIPLPEKAEDITTWRKVGRFLTTPLSLVASRFSPETAPKMWDIITQKDEFSFSDVLRDKGIDDRKSIWLGLFLDIALDPLNFLAFGGLTKLGRIARTTTQAKELREALKTSFKGVDCVISLFEELTSCLLPLSYLWRE